MVHVAALVSDINRKKGSFLFLSIKIPWLSERRRLYSNPLFLSLSIGQ